MHSEEPPGPASVDDTQELGVAAARARRPGPPTGALVAILVAGAIVGALAGMLFTRWWSTRYEAPETSSVGHQPVVVSPEVSEDSRAIPEIAFTTSPAKPQETPAVLEAGVKVVYCFFRVPGADPEATPVLQWLHAGGEPVPAEGDFVSEAGEELAGHIALKPPPGMKVFEDGVYEAALLVDGERMVEGSFAVLKGAAALLKETADRYRPEVREVVVSAGRPPARPKKPFVLPANASRAMLSFQYAHALSGTAFTVQWLYEDGLIQQATREVVIQGASGRGEAWFEVRKPGALPVGRYAVLISLGEGTPPLARQSFWVGRRPRAEELQPTAR